MTANDVPTEQLLVRGTASCVAVTLTKNLSYKYHGESRATAAYQGCLELAKRGDLWCLTGEYDYAQIDWLESLDQFVAASARNDAADGEMSWREDRRRLLLFPLKGKTPSDGFCRAVQLKSQERSKNTLIALLSWTLSPVAYQIREGVGSALRAIANLATLLDQARFCGLDLPEFAHFGSLSSPDLVTIALPESANEISTVHALARFARMLKLAELEQGCLAGHANYDSNRAREWPGHACVLVRPILGFRLDDPAMKTYEEFKATETARHFRYPFRLRVDCGHERQVVTDMTSEFGDAVAIDSYARLSPSEGQRGGAPELRTACGEDAEPDLAPECAPGLTWDTHLVHGSFFHLYDFARAWRDFWFEEETSWRQVHLLDSDTCLSLPDDGGDAARGKVLRQKQWKILDKVEQSLDEAWDSIEGFAGAFMNPTQQSEMRAIYSSFHSCFFRRDLAATACDLYPFFRQLGLALDDTRLWKAYLDPKHSDRQTALEVSSAFRRDFEALSLHAHRAVRNRIEHRAVGGDPPFPQTLREGACKFLSAYTVVLYLSWELFRRRRGDLPPGSFYDASHFAGCVCASTRGGVACQEIFSGTRHSAEFGKGYARAQGTALLSERDKDKWSSRLVVADVSGRLFGRPEVVTVTCLHETAELSDWILLSRCDDLRAAVNEWVLGSVSSLFCHETALARHAIIDDAKLSPAQRDAVKATKSRLQYCVERLVPYCSAVYELGPNKATDEGTTAKHVAEFINDLHPVDFVQSLIDAIYTCGAPRQTLGGLKAAFGQTAYEEGETLRPAEARFTRKAAVRKTLLDRLRSSRAFVKEVVPDCAMWMGLHHLLYSPGRGSVEDYSRDIVKLFGSILQLALESTGRTVSRKRIIDSIVRRWAIHAAAIRWPDTDWYDPLRVELQNIASRNKVKIDDSDLGEFRHDGPTFGAGGLVEALARYSAYGGDQEMEFVQLPFRDDGKPDLIVSALRDSWRDPVIENQIQLLLSFWALSVRFVTAELFERRSLESTGAVV